MVYMEPNGWAWAEIWIPQEAFDTVNNGNEMVHVRVTMTYQYWTVMNARDYYEPWGVSP